MKELISKEVATEQVNEWLDGKRVDPLTRTEKVQAVNKLVSAVMYGQLVIHTDGSLTHKLIYPVGDKTEFNYKGRLTVDEIEACMGVSTTSASKLYGAALTGENSGYIGKMDTADAGILNAVVVFFTS